MGIFKNLRFILSGTRKSYQDAKEVLSKDIPSHLGNTIPEHEKETQEQLAAQFDRIVEYEKIKVNPVYLKGLAGHFIRPGDYIPTLNYRYEYPGYVAPELGRISPLVKNYDIRSNEFALRMILEKLSGKEQYTHPDNIVCFALESTAGELDEEIKLGRYGYAEKTLDNTTIVNMSPDIERSIRALNVADYTADIKTELDTFALIDSLIYNIYQYYDSNDKVFIFFDGIWDKITHFMKYEIDSYDRSIEFARFREETMKFRYTYILMMSKSNLLIPVVFDKFTREEISLSDANKLRNITNARLPEHYRY